MDVQRANQSQTPGQKGPVTASAPGCVYDPLPSFQHLSLDSPSDQTPCHCNLQESNQSFQRDLNTLLPKNNTHPNMIYSNNADQRVQQIIRGVSSVVPAASQERNIPPCSLPFMNEGMQYCRPQQMSLYSPHSPYQAISPPFQPPYIRQTSLNGPQSPLQKHLPFSPPSFRQCGEEGSPQSPPPAFERTNVESADSAGYIYNHAALPSSPIQQQPQWTLPPHSKGRFICNMFTCMLQSFPQQVIL